MIWLLLLAEAHAGPGGSADPQLIASIVAAVVTALSGGGGLWWLRKSRVADEGRDDQSARAKAAIARDNADQVMRAVTDGYRDDLKGILAQIAEIKTTGATNEAACANIRDELRRIDRALVELRDELKQTIRDERGATQLAATSALYDRLGFVLEDIKRRGGDYADR